MDPITRYELRRRAKVRAAESVFLLCISVVGYAVMDGFRQSGRILILMLVAAWLYYVTKFLYYTWEDKL